MSFTWLEILELGAEVGEALLADTVAIEADQAVSSPPIDVDLDGHKYTVTVNLSPVASTAAAVTEGTETIAPAPDVEVEKPA